LKTSTDTHPRISFPSVPSLPPLPSHLPLLSSFPFPSYIAISSPASAKGSERALKLPSGSAERGCQTAFSASWAEKRAWRADLVQFTK